MRRFVAAVITVGALTACSSQPAEPASPPLALPSVETVVPPTPELVKPVMGKWGQPFTVTNREGQSGELTVEESKAYEKPAEDPGAADAVYEVFRITAEAAESNTGLWSVMDHHFYMRTPEGDRYDSMVLSQFAPMFDGERLSPGEQLRGYLVFDVPIEGRYRLVYADTEQAVAEWGAAS